MKTFKEFITEASREEAEKKRLAKDNPDEWRVRNTGSGRWTTKRKSSIQGQGERRSQNLKPLTTRELEDHCKRNLHPGDCKKNAKKAIRIEGGRKRAQKTDARNRTQQTGQQYDVDHIQGQPNRRREGLRSRFQKIHPGDSSDNRQVMHGDENRSKNSKNTQRSTTRAGAVRAALMRARE
jgi:hypothetical protein